mmetsp:Transcript_19202/g.33090  ORF Transcript_19202/g.33090 Transcript_19202/m.33090 type:complete len:103 (-) Transcript_19202:975-1283(-)
MHQKNHITTKYVHLHGLNDADPYIQLAADMSWLDWSQSAVKCPCNPWYMHVWVVRSMALGPSFRLKCQICGLTAAMWPGQLVNPSVRETHSQRSSSIERRPF